MLCALRGLTPLETSLAIATPPYPCTAFLQLHSVRLGASLPAAVV